VQCTHPGGVVAHEDLALSGIMATWLVVSFGLLVMLIVLVGTSSEAVTVKGPLASPLRTVVVQCNGFWDIIVVVCQLLNFERRTIYK